MPDEQDAPVGRHGAQRVQRLRGIEALASGGCSRNASRCCSLQDSAANSAVWRARALGLNSTTSKVSIEPHQGYARGACLSLAPSGQPALGIRARAVRLGLCMT